MSKYDKIIFVNYGETWLKSPSVRHYFERTLKWNLKTIFPKGTRITASPGRLWIDTSKVPKQLKNVFGVESYSVAWICDKDMDEIKKLAKTIAKSWKGKTFAVRSRRTDKSFPLTSQQINHKVGWVIPKKADLSNPKHTLYIEIREKAYLYDKSVRGPAGLPLGTGGKAVAQLRDQDDLLAAWLIARRGVLPILIKPKKSLQKILQAWCIGRKVEQVKTLAEAKKNKAAALVDSRSMKNSEKGLLILNPLVGFSKTEKAKLLKKIRLTF